ncbi:hypothetical protein GF412_00110 [Candidatus Micrarchaeota archaeon]|nr:hypothetical protein [Candidatus Micrarchaeota archaeon]MBD3417379.1 hypothetical protein [Candidatus Micrarchaeota archaeon]
MPEAKKKKRKAADIGLKTKVPPGEKKEGEVPEFQRPRGQGEDKRDVVFNPVTGEEKRVEEQEKKEQEGPEKPETRAGDILFDPTRGKKRTVERHEEIAGKEEGENKHKARPGTKIGDIIFNPVTGEEQEVEWKPKAEPTQKEREVQQQERVPTIQDILDSIDELYSSISANELDTIVAHVDSFQKAMNLCDDPSKSRWEKHAAWTRMEEAYHKLDEELIPEAIEKGIITGYIASNLGTEMEKHLKKRGRYA